MCPKFMLKSLFVVLVVAIVFFGVSAHSAPATKEQEKLINSLSSQQLYELYAEQALQMTEQMVQNKDLLRNPNFRSKVKDCFIKLEKSTFTEKEMREIFIQPIGMDTKYYQRKIDQMNLGIEPCIVNALP